MSLKHSFLSNSRGLCKQILDGYRYCGEPESAPMHTNLCEFCGALCPFNSEEPPCVGDVIAYLWEWVHTCDKHYEE